VWCSILGVAGGFFVLSCSFVMFVCCFGDGAKEAHAEFPADAEVAAESVIPADEIFCW
jgi:hypothetical protein